MKQPLLLMMLMLGMGATVVNECYAQRLESYTASNDVTYNVGDTILLGRGSAPNGFFVYLKIGGIATSTSGQPDVASHYSGTNVIVKKIRQYKQRGIKKTYFSVGAGNIVNYMLMIEDAIATCEVVPCNSQNENQVVIKEDNKYDKLKKLKGLLDEGILTQDEYNSEKKKLLEEN